MPIVIFSNGHGEVPECVAVLVFAVLSSVQTRQPHRLCKQNEVVLLVGEPSFCLIASHYRNVSPIALYSRSLALYFRDVSPMGLYSRRHLLALYLRESHTVVLT